ncbi:MAG: hypothetical protein Kow0069_03890 [Promethearchaeota archaeon]
METLSPEEGKPKITLARRLVQVASFLLVNYVVFEVLFSTSLYLLDPYFLVLPFLHTPRAGWSRGSGLFELFMYQVTQGTFPFLLFGVLILLGLFGGRVFCGWACPTGTLQDLFAKFPSKNRRMSIQRDRSTKKVKLVVLVLILLMFFPVGFLTFNDTVQEYALELGDLADRPVSLFSLSEFLFAFFPSRLRLFVDDPTSNPFFSSGWVALRLLLFSILCVVSAYYPRFYCRVLCPYGAFISLFSEYSFVRLGRNPVKCPGRKECGECEKACPLQIRILDEPWEGFTGGGECVLCLKCKERCPHKAIEWRFL